MTPSLKILLLLSNAVSNAMATHAAIVAAPNIVHSPHTIVTMFDVFAIRITKRGGVLPPLAPFGTERSTPRRWFGGTSRTTTAGGAPVVVVVAAAVVCFRNNIHIWCCRR